MKYIEQFVIPVLVILLLTSKFLSKEDLVNQAMMALVFVSVYCVIYYFVFHFFRK